MSRRALSFLHGNCWGELLLELQQPTEALKEFEASLIRTPNRRNGIDRAAQAAKLAGDQQKARSYNEQLQALAVPDN